jgi:hypothetical protein
MKSGVDSKTRASRVRSRSDRALQCTRRLRALPAHPSPTSDHDARAIVEGTAIYLVLRSMASWTAF